MVNVCICLDCDLASVGPGGVAYPVHGGDLHRGYSNVNLCYNVVCTVGGCNAGLLVSGLRSIQNAKVTGKGNCNSFASHTCNGVGSVQHNAVGVVCSVVVIDQFLGSDLRIEGDLVCIVQTCILSYKLELNHDLGCINSGLVKFCTCKEYGYVMACRNTVVLGESNDRILDHVRCVGSVILLGKDTIRIVETVACDLSKMVCGDVQTCLTVLCGRNDSRKSHHRDDEHQKDCGDRKQCRSVLLFCTLTFHYNINLS